MAFGLLTAVIPDIEHKKKVCVMKTSLIIIMLMAFSAGASPESTGDGFVIADGITYFCQDMRIGLAKTLIVTTGGDIVKVPSNKVQAYRLNGHQYELLPLVNRRGDTLAQAFMEFITMRYGHRLYRYCSNCSKYDPLNGEIAPINRVYRYYVLHEGRMKLLPDEEEAAKILAYFNVKVINDRRRK